MAKVSFHASCKFAGVDMSEEEEIDLTYLDSDYLEALAYKKAHEWAGVEYWYEIEEDDDESE